MALNRSKLSMHELPTTDGRVINSYLKPISLILDLADLMRTYRPPSRAITILAELKSPGVDKGMTMLRVWGNYSSLLFFVKVGGQSVSLVSCPKIPFNPFNLYTLPFFFLAPSPCPCPVDLWVRTNRSLFQDLY